MCFSDCAAAGIILTSSSHVSNERTLLYLPQHIFVSSLVKMTFLHDLTFYVLLCSITKWCILFQYFVFLFLLLCAELSIAVTTLVYREDFLTGLENRLLNRFRDQYGGDSNVFTQAIDQAQFTVSPSYSS